jgi:hypothetical protein
MRWSGMAGKRFLSLFVCCLLLCANAGAAWSATPEVSNILITDVTPVSFSVVWTASGPSNCGINVFTDEKGLQELTDLLIEPMPVANRDPTIVSDAIANGVMKVRVNGLSPDTTYYFQTITISQATFEEISFPETPPFLAVTTESVVTRGMSYGASIIPFSNDVIWMPCYRQDGITPATGGLLLACAFGSEYPVSSFVGDGVEIPYACVDLNNLFSEVTHETLFLPGLQFVTFMNYMGLEEGYGIRNQAVPCNVLLAEFREPVVKVECKGDFQGDGSVGAEDLGSFGNYFSRSDAWPLVGDFDADGDVDGADLAAFVEEFGRDDCPACD